MEERMLAQVVATRFVFNMMTAVKTAILHNDRTVRVHV